MCTGSSCAHKHILSLKLDDLTMYILLHKLCGICSTITILYWASSHGYLQAKQEISWVSICMEEVREWFNHSRTSMWTPLVPFI